MGAARKVELASRESKSSLADVFDVSDDLEHAKCVVKFLAELTHFGVFSGGNKGIVISADGEHGLYSILQGVAGSIDGAIEKISLENGVQ